MRRNSFILILIVFVFIFSATTNAVTIPSWIVMEKERVLKVKNNGTEATKVEIMPRDWKYEDGVPAYESYGTLKNSLSMNFSPKKFTLKPGETQRVFIQANEEKDPEVTETCALSVREVAIDTENVKISVGRFVRIFRYPKQIERKGYVEGVNVVTSSGTLESMKVDFVNNGNVPLRVTGEIRVLNDQGNLVSRRGYRHVLSIVGRKDDVIGGLEMPGELKFLNSENEVLLETSRNLEIKDKIVVGKKDIETEDSNVKVTVFRANRSDESFDAEEIKVVNEQGKVLFNSSSLKNSQKIVIKKEKALSFIVMPQRQKTITTKVNMELKPRDYLALAIMDFGGENKFAGQRPFTITE